MYVAVKLWVRSYFTPTTNTVPPPEIVLTHHNIRMFLTPRPALDFAYLVIN